MGVAIPARLTCAVCGAGLVGAFHGVRCPQGEDCRPHAGREILGLALAEPPEPVA